MLDDMASSSTPSRRARTRFTEVEIAYMVGRFDVNPYPNEVVQREIAEYLGLSVLNIKNFFENRRKRNKLEVRIHPGHQNLTAPNNLTAPIKAPGSCTKFTGIRRKFTGSRIKFTGSRTAFTPQQLRALNECFETNQYPKIKERKIMAARLGLTERNIFYWVINRRNRNNTTTTPNTTGITKNINHRMKEGGKRKKVPYPIKLDKILKKLSPSLYMELDMAEQDEDDSEDDDSEDDDSEVEDYYYGY